MVFEMALSTLRSVGSASARVCATRRQLSSIETSLPASFRCKRYLSDQIWREMSVASRSAIMAGVLSEVSRTSGQEPC